MNSATHLHSAEYYMNSTMRESASHEFSNALAFNGALGFSYFSSRRSTQDIRNKEKRRHCQNFTNSLFQQRRAWIQ